MAESEFAMIRHVKKRAWLIAYAKTGQYGKAAEAAGCSRQMHLLWQRQDPEFVAALEVAKQLALEFHEDLATQRAIEGSDTMLIFRLKALCPERYRENTGTTVNNQVNLQVNVSFSSRLNAANQEAEIVRGAERHSLPLQR